MRRAFALAPALLSGLALASLAQAEEPLRFNPFLEPDPRLLESPARESQPERREGDWEPILRATLVAGEQSLANLGGEVLRHGEETHGYRLLEVRTWDAVFSRNGERVVLPVKRREED